MIESLNSLPIEAQADAHRFRKCLPMRMGLHEIMRTLGDTEGLTCIDIGADNGLMSFHLRRHGGTWHSAVTSDRAKESVRAVVGENVLVLNSKDFPFEDKSFDVVVIVDVLERVPSDIGFIEECHRILKPDGMLVVNVARMKPVSLVNALRGILGPRRAKAVRPGYTESELFSLLKTGFDVHNVRTYCRFFVEAVDTIMQLITTAMDPDTADYEKRIMRQYSVAGFFYSIMSQLDMLIFFTKGHRLIAGAQRRAWRVREAPILVDGRSISEVVLSKAAN